MSVEVENPVGVEEELLTKVSNQIGFYFGNVNLLRDRFMKEVMMKNDGWVPISTLLTYNRLKNLVKDLDDEGSIKIVVDVANKLSTLEVDTDGTKIRRDPQIGLPKTRSENTTLIVKGFVLENITLDDLQEFFKKYAGVEAVVMRNYREKVVKKSEEENTVKEEVPELVYVKKFKGSVFVVFDTVDNAKLCLTDLEGFKEESKLLNKETPMTVMWQADHKLAKQAEIKARQELKRKANEPTKEKSTYTRGTVLNMKNVPVEVTREKLKEVWAKALKDYEGEEDLKIAFVDYKIGQLEGRIRLSSPFNKKAVEFMQGKLILKEDTPAVELSELTTEEEDEYLKQVEQFTSNFKAKRGRGGFGNRGRGGRRGGRGGFRGGRR